ncbi:anti-sigma factor [Pseudonocardia sp.]|uniref:anti-sigma factor family protein n=1 Tax=Pseudonocardia sp. TaxID=60912 RepID=UPI002615B657|nr:anti-sigma factor [Pseudonocardia sp.]
MTGETHRSLREELGAYALGQLSGDRWRAVHDHLEVCALCRTDLDEIAPVAGLLGVTRDRLRPDDLTGDVTPAPPPLSDDLLAEVRTESGPASPGEQAPPRRRTALLAAAAAAGVLVAGGIGFVVGGSGGPDVPSEAVAVRALAPGIAAEAALINHTWGMEVVLTATGFEAGEAYVVTVTDDAGNTVGAGEFLGTGDDRMRCNLNSSILRADASLVQVTAPDGEVVLDAAV